MVTAIPAVSSVYAASTLPSSGPISQLAQNANSLIYFPSVILTLGTTSTVPLTYNAAGLFESLLQVADTSQGTATSATAAVSTANTANAAATATTTATGNSATSAADLAALTELATIATNATNATNAAVLNASTSLQSLPATTDQAIMALLAPDANASSASGAGTLTADQTLARQKVADLNSAATALNTATTATTGNSTTSVADLAALLGLDATAISTGALNISANLQNLPTTTAQALMALLAPDVNPTSAGGAGTLTVNQALARQMLIDFYSAAAGLNTTTTTTTTTPAATAPNATAILQVLPPNSTVQGINSLLSTDLGLAAATLLNSTGTAATTTTAAGNTWTTTVATPATTATPTNADTALDTLLQGNAEPTTATTAAVGNAVPPAAATPVAATPTTIAATPATAAPIAAPVATAAGNATTTAVAVNPSATPVATTPLANEFLIDYAAQALASITKDPAYANTVAGLYMNVAILRAEQAAATAMPNITDVVAPVKEVPRVNPVTEYTGSRRAA